MKSKEQKRKEAIERQKQFDRLTLKQKIAGCKGKQRRRYELLAEKVGFGIQYTGDVSAYPNGRPLFV